MHTFEQKYYAQLSGDTSSVIVMVPDLVADDYPGYWLRSEVFPVMLDNGTLITACVDGDATGLTTNVGIDGPGDLIVMRFGDDPTGDAQN